MSDFIVGIHGITNEMVANAPSMPEVIERIRIFFEGSVLMAHHAPFDLGFMAYAFEKHQLNFPRMPACCTSLLSRKLIHGVENHRLQTLVKHLGIDGGSAHRALDDARACLLVGLKCFEIIGANATLKDIYKAQGKKLEWPMYSLLNQGPIFDKIISVTEQEGILEIVYGKEESPRKVKPLGIVRNPDGDYMQAICLRDQQSKRFYIAKIKSTLP